MFRVSKNEYENLKVNAGKSISICIFCHRNIYAKQNLYHIEFKCFSNSFFFRSYNNAKIYIYIYLVYFFSYYIA